MAAEKGEAIKEKGNKHFLQRKYNDAIQCYNQAIKQNGEKSIYYINRALCYIKLKQWDKVYQDARHCLDLDPNYIKAHVYLGQYYLDQQSYDEAIESFKQALELCKVQDKHFGDEIQRLLRYAHRLQFSMLEQKRVEKDIQLQTYLHSLIDNDRERQKQMIVENYFEEHQSSEVPVTFLQKYQANASQSGDSNDVQFTIDPQLEETLSRIDRETEQVINEVNNLFNEVDLRRKKREIPEYLTCKLCYDLMQDPVITPFGITYCRSCIEENLYKVSHLDPIANKPLVVEQLISNLVLKEIIEKFIKDNDWVNAECF